MSFLPYLYTYVIGGLTFLPLCVVVFYFMHPVHHETPPIEEKFRAGELEDNARSGVQALKAGWVTVTHEYWLSTEEISLSTQSINDSAESKSAYSSLYKLANKAEEGDSKGSSTSLSGPTPASPSSDDKKVKGAEKRHRFYAVLKHGNLFLYKDASLKDVKHVIVISSQVVTMWPRGTTDGQLFTKNSAICIMKKDWSRHRRLLDSFECDTISTQDILATENQHKIKAPKGSVFLYCDYNIDKEDWYFALIQASKADSKPSALNPNTYAKPLHFATDDMIDMIQTLYSTEGQLHSKWFNALTGRLFLALQRTPVMSRFLENRIAKKLNKIKTPGFLEKFQIKKIDPGTSVPFFTYPHLKEVNPDGTLVLSVCVHYHGKMAIQIATKANIKLGNTFKPREVDLLLSVTLEKLEGQMIIKFKPPPSDRIWYTFETEPTMDLKIEPIISSRQFNYNIITSTIGKKFKEAIRESLVLPHYDDLVFYDTFGEVYRGGIWNTEEREQDFDTEEVSQPVEFSDSESNAATDLDFSKATPKVRLTNTFNDFSKKLKKTKSTHTVGLSEDQFMSDGSVLDNKGEEGEGDADTIGKKSMNTLKKIGKWYFKDEKKPQTTNTLTESPDIFVSRRAPRKSNADLTMSMSSSTSSKSLNLQTKNFISSSSFIRLSGGEYPRSTLSPSKSTLVDTDSASLSMQSETSAAGESSVSTNDELATTNLQADPGPAEISPVLALAEDAPNGTHTKMHRKPPPESFESLERGGNSYTEDASANDTLEEINDIQA